MALECSAPGASLGLATLIVAGWVGLSIRHAPVYKNSSTAIAHGLRNRPDSVFLNRSWSRKLRKMGADGRADFYHARAEELREIMREQARRYREEKDRGIRASRFRDKAD